MQEQLHVRKRLEPGAEARLRLTDAFRDRPHSPTIEGVEMENAVGLTETEGAKDDRLRLVGPSHAAKSRACPEAGRGG